MSFEFKKVLFLGIGGVSMHQLAISMSEIGVEVLGYDEKENNYTALLKDAGIKVSNKFVRSFCNVDLCVKTPAVPETNKYVKELTQAGVKIIDRAELLSWLCKKFKKVIAVAGTHGKSTTASLIYEILRQNNDKVSCHIGADVKNPRFCLGDDFLVVEACEYNKSFLHLFPDITVVTNVEPDHMECYKNMFSLYSAFSKFLKRGEKRYVFACPTTKFFKRIKNVCFVEKEKHYETSLEGEFNQNNISLAMKVCCDLGVEEKSAEKAVKSFCGIARRDEFLGSVGETKIFIDYAHHPTEIEQFYLMFKEKFNNPLVIFQPHTYSRTKFLKKQFVSVLSKISNLMIFKEYPARETSKDGLSAFQLFQFVKEKNKGVTYFENDKIVKKILGNFDAVAFVGAGDIDQLAKNIIKTNQKNG